MKPVAVIVVSHSPEAWQEARDVTQKLRDGGIPTFVTLERGARALRNTLDYYNLQKSIMEIRKVPIRTILQKAPRMARDVAAGCGKEVNIELRGEDVEVDKRLIEVLGGPLTHMVRNSVDHGIETPDQREALGKERQGHVKIEVTENDSDIFLAISDDGKGLDFDAIFVAGTIPEAAYFVEQARGFSNPLSIRHLVFVA